MKFVTFVRVALEFGVVLLVIGALRWWSGADFSFESLALVWVWTCLVLLGAWGASPRYVPPEDVAELERRRVTMHMYQRWLASFDDVALVLRNMEAEALGEELSGNWPPGGSGPWELSALREVLRIRQQAAAAKVAA